MHLRTGKTKALLESSIDAALLAVEIYNKPRTTFRSQSYITLMVIAWTYLLHAHFNKTIGNKYYYKEDNGRFKIVDGERKAWELKTCIDKYGALKEPIRQNLLFFIGLRNKIEHRFAGRKEFDIDIFGECQALLYNYESVLTEVFGQEYQLNTHLVYSIQFSMFRTNEQIQANRRALTGEAANVKQYIDNFRTALPDDVFNSQQYSIKLIQIPKISNTNRGDLAIEFVKWSELNEGDKANYDRLAAIIKDRVNVREAVNAGRLKAGEVLARLEEISGIKIDHAYHKYLYINFEVRPPGSSKDKTNTNTKYCHYDDAHGDYMYQECWVDFLAKVLQSGKITKEGSKQAFDEGRKYTIQEFE
jgi:hypothetical protein